MELWANDEGDEEGGLRWGFWMCRCADFRCEDL